MLIFFTLRIKRDEIREVQIKYARTALMCINEEEMGAELMTKDLRFPRESWIKTAGDANHYCSPHQLYLCELQM